ncbi:MAG TPA: glucose-6-phosphate dehydrogenase, partial [Streptosporangiaceae bacterium]|nr:glucose-6-phosphate dehydrogenase [Streptosporangiaceae bacterium]
MDETALDDEARRAPACALVIFGASGDLTERKLLPAIRQLAAHHRLGPEFALVGVARTAMSDEEWAGRCQAAETSKTTFRYISGGYDDPDTYQRLSEVLADCDRALGTKGQHVFYLATPPRLFGTIAVQLGRSGLNGSAAGDWPRLVIEKPFGWDEASARSLYADISASFTESQIYRIDHYLAKDTVQNVLALRFSNSLFEPVWNRNLVESILITAAEEEGIGTRAGYYDHIGAVRDMIQNHVLQLLALVTMEPPITFDAEYIRRAKHLALRSMSPLDPASAVRGQYEGYLDEEGVSPDSRRETYAAARISIENWRWDGVPIFVRTGKALKRRATEIVIKLRDAPSLRVGGRRQRGIP